MMGDMATTTSCLTGVGRAAQELDLLLRLERFTRELLAKRPGSTLEESSDKLQELKRGLKSTLRSLDLHRRAGKRKR